MIKAIDSFSLKGTSHIHNEDFSHYYYDSEQDFLLGIVCDGCSSAINTHIGSMLIGSSLFEKILIFKDNLTSQTADTVITGWLKIVLENEYHSFKKEAFGESFLESTVMVIIKIQNYLKIFMFGDGAVLLENNEGAISSFVADFTNNMPFYESYKAKKIEKLFDEQNIKQTIHHIIYPQSPSGYISDFTTVRPYDEYSKEPFCIEVDLDNHSKILLSTDGLFSFDNLDFKEILSIKNITGSFALRRAIAMEKKSSHYDDFSGIIVVL